MDPDKLQEQLISLAAIVDMRLNGMISSTDNKEPLSRADNTTEEQEAHMKKTINKTAKKSAKKSKVDTKGKTSKKKARDDEDGDEEDEDESDDDDEESDDDEEESDDEDGDEEDEDESDDDDEESDDDEEESDDEDGDEEDEEESDDDEEEESDDDEEESDDEDGDEEDEEESDDDEEEVEEEVVSPKLKKGEYTIQKNDFTFEVVEGKNGYKKGDQVEIKRATQASYDKTTVFEVSGAKDTAKRTWVVLSAKRKHLVVPVEFVLNSKGKPAEILEAEAPAKSSKKSAKVEKPAKKGAKVEASTGSNKKALKLIASIEATLADLKASL